MWYVPIRNGKTAMGSAIAHHSNYVRKDKVRDVVTALANQKQDGIAPDEIYRITDKQFWDCDWLNVDVLKRIGVKVYDRYC